MAGIRENLDKVRNQNAVVVELHERYNAIFILQLRIFEDHQQRLAETPLSRTRRIIARKQIKEQRKLLTAIGMESDQIHSWKSYLEDWIEVMVELFELWDEIFDWVEDNLLARCTTGPQSDGEESDDGSNTVTGDSEDTGVAGTVERQQKHLQLYTMLKDVEARSARASEGVTLHGGKVMGFIQKEEEPVIL